MNITDIRALLYVPESRPGFFEQSREGESGIALYCRKVLIQNKTENIAPKWMRFVKGKQYLLPLGSLLLKNENCTFSDISHCESNSMELYL